VIRSAQALVEGTVVLGPGCADPFSPKAVRAAMGSVFAQPLLRASVGETPQPRVALVAHGGVWPVPLLGTGTGMSGGKAAAIGVWPSPVTICLGAEREGLPPEVLEACERRLTIPLHPGAESLNVAATAAIVLQGISSPAPEGRSNG